MSNYQKNIFAKDGTYTVHYKNMCWKKIWYPTEYAAVKAALDFMEMDGKPWKQYRAYLCEYCSGWHLTGKEPNITQDTLRKIKSKTKCKNGKKIYLTESAAKQAARDSIHGFCKCSVCGYWHLCKDARHSQDILLK